jgi:hypothetical protein
MNEVAYNNMLGVLDESIALAADAVKAAEDRSTSVTPAVLLVKVASARYHEVAKALIKTGSFPGKTVDGLAKSLEGFGIAGHLELMEKLASKAIFPLDADVVLGGDLVEKSTERRMDELESGSKSAVWRDAMNDAGF